MQSEFEKKNDAQRLSFRGLHATMRGQRMSTDIKRILTDQGNGSIAHMESTCGNMTIYAYVETCDM